MDNNKYTSKIYKEISHDDDEFLTESIFLYGYDINEELMPKIDFIDWIGINFFKRKLNTNEKKIISKLPILISNKGFRDPGILSSSMSATVRNPNQNSLISMISSSGGLYKGSKEIEILCKTFYSLENKNKLFSVESIYEKISELKGKKINSYGTITHLLGFNEWTETESKRLDNLLNFFSKYETLYFLKFIKENKIKIEEKANQKIDLTIIISAIFFDLKLNIESLEFFYFFLLTPFCNSIKEDQKNVRKFPFYNNLFKEDE